MVTRTVIAVWITYALLGVAHAAPNAVVALEHFRTYQQRQLQGKSSERAFINIFQALEFNAPLVRKSHIYPAQPILIIVAYSRLQFGSQQKPFLAVLDEVFRLLPSGNFERRFYQLNDLHAGQARQSIWQLKEGGSIMRIEIIPGTSVTIALFSANDSRIAQHETRRALVPQKAER